MRIKLDKLRRAFARMTLAKLVNILILYFQKIIEKGDFSLGKPAIIYFDPSSFCNLHCLLCPTGLGKTGRTKYMMNFADYKKVIDDLKKYLFFIYLANWGEPLINPELTKMISYANRNNIDTILCTNLTLLEPETAESLIKSGLNEIVISLDGATEKTYAKYRVGGDFNQVVDNLKLLASLKKKYSSPIMIKWQFLVFSGNEHEIKQAEEMSRSIGGIIFCPAPLRINMDLETSNIKKQEIRRNLRWFPKKRKYQRYNLSDYSNMNKLRDCRWLWTQAVVNADGSVSPCCSVWEEKNDFGNAFQDGIIKVWNNDKYQEARRIIRTRKPDKKNICSNCIKNGFIN